MMRGHTSPNLCRKTREEVLTLVEAVRLGVDCWTLSRSLKSEYPPSPLALKALQRGIPARYSPR